MSKLILYVDFDQTILDSTQIMIDCYEHLTGEKALTRKDYTWNLKSAFPNYDKEIIHKIFEIPMFFELANKYVFKGCKRRLYNLSKHYDIKIISCGTDENLRLKGEWIEENLPFVQEFIPLSQNGKVFDKSICEENSVIIDDRIDCLLSAKNCFRILFKFDNRPYEWQNGYEEFIYNGDINGIATAWNEEFENNLIEYANYLER